MAHTMMYCYLPQTPALCWLRYFATGLFLLAFLRTFLHFRCKVFGFCTACSHLSATP